MINFNFSLYNFFQAIMIFLGMWLIAKLMWMCIYQYKYGGNYGERYYKGLISKDEKKS